jgi:hypothetical protein
MAEQLEQAAGGDSKPEWQPVQYSVTPGPDMRNSKLGPRGYKAKRKREISDALEQQQEEAGDAMDADEPQQQASSAKRQRVEGAPFREVRIVWRPLTLAPRVWRARIGPAAARASVTGARGVR